MLTSASKRGQRLATRFLRLYLQELKRRKTPLRLLIDALDSSDEDVVAEASGGLIAFGRNCLSLVLEQSSTTRNAMDEGILLCDSQLTFPVADRRELFFPPATWSLIFHSAVTLLKELVHQGYHKSSVEAHVSSSPSVRYNASFRC